MKKYLMVLAAVALIAGGLLLMSGCTSRDSELVGVWEWDFDSNFVTTFNEDGTGTHALDWGLGRGTTFTWSTSGNYIVMNYPNQPRMRYGYRISGDVLTFSFTDGDLRYTRVR